jgi:hypothetical protein
MATASTQGTHLVDMVKFLRTQRDAALAILPARLHRYLDEQLNVAAWYPEEDMIGLVRALALWRSMHDTGEFKLTVEDDHAEARLAGRGYVEEEFFLSGTANRVSPREYRAFTPPRTRSP